MSGCTAVSAPVRAASLTMLCLRSGKEPHLLKDPLMDPHVCRWRPDSGGVPAAF